jgi:hypothetical protein
MDSPFVPLGDDGTASPGHQVAAHQAVSHKQRAGQQHTLFTTAEQLGHPRHQKMLLLACEINSASIKGDERFDICHDVVRGFDPSRLQHHLSTR